jgi:hypothetical protein
VTPKKGKDERALLIIPTIFYSDFRREDPNMPMDVSATCNSPCFIYTKAEIAASPSIVDGMSPADEQSIRSYEMDKIAYYGIELTHSKEMVYTSMMLWHRFYIRRSLRAYDPALLSVACLLLSSKICETLRFLKEERYLRDFVRIYLHRKEGLRAIDFETSVRAPWSLPAFRAVDSIIPPGAASRRS